MVHWRDKIIPLKREEKYPTKLCLTQSIWEISSVQMSPSLCFIYFFGNKSETCHFTWLLETPADCTPKHPKMLRSPIVWCSRYQTTNGKQLGTALWQFGESLLVFMKTSNVEAMTDIWAYTLRAMKLSLAIVFISPVVQAIIEVINCWHYTLLKATHVN